LKCSLKTVRIEETEYSLKPADITLKKPGLYALKVVNTGSTTHALEVDGEGLEEYSKKIGPGQSTQLRLDLRKAGTYELTDPLDHHEEKGMEGKLVVKEGGHAAKKVGDSAEVDLKPANGSGTSGTATFSKAKGGGVKVVLKVSGLPKSTKMYLAHIHPGTCAEEEGSAGEHGHSHHEHGASEEIECPLTPVEPNAQGDGTSTTVLHHVTLEGLLSGEPKHVNVHKPGSGEPPPVTCADLSEAR
jgi:plastocyanin